MPQRSEGSLRDLWRVETNSVRGFGFAAEGLAQLVLGALEGLETRLAEILAGAVDVEVQHRHGRAEGRGLPAMAALGRALQRLGDGSGTALLENAVLKRHGVAALGDARRPFLRGALGLPGSGFAVRGLAARGFGSGHGWL